MPQPRRKAARGNGLQIPGAGTRDFARLGPAMRALNDRQRSFVVAMLDQGMVNHTRAAMAAGYQGTENSLRVAAHRLAHDERIQAAMQEEARKRMTSGAMMAVNTLLNIAENPVHKDQLKAVQMILDRSGLHALSEHKVTIERSGGTPEEVAQQIKLLATELGMDPMKLLGRSTTLALAAPAAVEDAEFEEVEDSEKSVEGLEDLL